MVCESVSDETFSLNIQYCYYYTIKQIDVSRAKEKYFKKYLKKLSFFVKGNEKTEFSSRHLFFSVYGTAFVRY